MKKTLLVVVTVVALIVAVYFADRATRVGAKNNAARSDVPTTGQMAPEISLKDIEDKSVSLSQLKGKVVLIDFWATWCEPCKAEIPSLIALQEKYGAKGFTVLGIAMDEEGKKIVEPFVAKEQFDVNGQKELMNYPIVIGDDATADKFGGLLGYPTGVLISKDGRQVTKFVGGKSYSELAKLIEGQL